MKKIFSFALRIIPRKYLQLFAHFISRFIGLFYKGNNVECTVCSKTYREFLPFGRNAASRNNALCPNCLSLERHRMIWYYLKNNTNIFSIRNKMLHIAPEYSFIDRFKKIPNLNYITGDLESPLADVQLNVLDIPFENEQFDVVMCNHVMEHIVDDHKALSELYRVLKNGGWAILMVPIDITLERTYEDFSITTPSEREKHFGQNDHVRQYGLDYKERLEKVGFRVEIYDYANTHPEVAKRYAFLSSEPLYVCFK